MVDPKVAKELFVPFCGGGVEAVAKSRYLRAARVIAPYFPGQWPSWRLTWEYMCHYMKHYKRNLERDMAEFNPAIAHRLVQIPVRSVLETFVSAMNIMLMELLPGYKLEHGFDMDAFIDVTRRANIHINIEIFPRDPNIPKDSFRSMIAFEKPLLTTEAFRTDHGENAEIEMIYPLIALETLRSGGTQEEAQERFNHHQGIWQVRSDACLHHFMSVVALIPECGELLEPHMQFDGDNAHKKDGMLRFTRM